jgi:hypothetical protein
MVLVYLRSYHILIFVVIFGHKPSLLWTINHFVTGLLKNCPFAFSRTFNYSTYRTFFRFAKNVKSLLKLHRSTSSSFKAIYPPSRPRVLRLTSIKTLIGNVCRFLIKYSCHLRRFISHSMGQGHLVSFCLTQVLAQELGHLLWFIWTSPFTNWILVLRH